MTLLEECIDVLGKNVEIINDLKIIDKISSKMFFTLSGRVEWDKYRNVVKLESLNDIKSKSYFIMWTDSTLPLLKCDWNVIVENIFDVLAVSFDTWFVSDDLTEIVEIYHNGEITFGNIP